MIVQQEIGGITFRCVVGPHVGITERHHLIVTDDIGITQGRPAEYERDPRRRIGADEEGREAIDYTLRKIVLPALVERARVDRPEDGPLVAAAPALLALCHVLVNEASARGDYSAPHVTRARALLAKLGEPDFAAMAELGDPIAGQRRFTVTLDYQTGNGSPASARFDIQASGEENARSRAETILRGDRRRRVVKIVGGTVELGK